MEISTKQLNVLNYIKMFISEHGYSPTVREICTGLALKSPSTVHEHIKNLAFKGVLTINPNKSRTIELLVENEYIKENNNLVKIPVITDNCKNNVYKDYTELPVFMLNGYDSKNIVIFNESSTKMYIVNKALKPLEKSLVLVDNDSLKVEVNELNKKIVGTVISEFKAY